MPILQPLPLSSSRHDVRPRPSPSSSFDPKDRLCWVHRVSKGSHQHYLWPALYYENWSEACHELSQVLTPDENRKLCLQLYSHAVDGTLSPTTVVAQILLGTTSSSSSSEMEFVELPADSDAVFGQFFGGYFAQAMQMASHPSCFDHDKEWQLEFRQAVDQAVRLSKGETLVTAAAASSSSPVMTAAAEAKTPCEASVAANQEAPQGISLSGRPSPGLTTISPSSSSSQHETPTRSNKSSHLTIMEQQDQDQEQQQSKEQEQRTLFPRSPHTTGSDDDDSSSAGAATTLALTKVTPSRTSSRSRRKAVQKTDRLTPTSSKSRKSLKRRHDKNDDDDAFYAFKPLITLLTKELKWVYRRARDKIHAWVYLRPGKDEKNGNLLEDYFYEEHQVVDYCKANNYKQILQRLLDDSMNNINHKDDDASCITPSPRKKIRSTTA